MITHLEAAGQALQQETAWETASEHEQALVAQLQSHGMSGQMLSGRDEVLARLRQQHDIDEQDAEAIRRMEEISREREHQLTYSR